MLFDNLPRDQDGPIREAQTSFDYYSRSNRPELIAACAILERFFANYPARERDWLRSRMIVESEFDGAFFELFTHEYLRQVAKEVLIPERNGSMPDFLSIFDGQEVFVEATEITGATTEQRRKREKMDRIYHAINRLESPYFFFGMGMMPETDKIPPPRGVRLFVQQIIHSLSPSYADYLLNKGDRYGSGSELSWSYEEGPFRLRLRAFPKEAWMRADPTFRTLQIYPSEAAFLHQGVELQASIRKKAKKKYPIEGKAFVVASNAVQRFGGADMDDTLDALYRGISGQSPLWLNHNRRVSAVIIFRVFPSNIHKASGAVFHCPSPYVSCESLPWRIDKFTFKGGALAGMPGLTAASLFDL